MKGSPLKKLVVLTGAGISADSGLKTFRDSDGLWEGHDVTTVATPEAWFRNPSLVLDFYNQRRRDVRNARPNAAHFGLAQLQEHFEVSIITQNIDDLHERAGSQHVLHLHGQIFQMRSQDDETLIYPIEGDIRLGDFADDGAQLRPHIVWFGEEVPAIEQAVPIMRNADIFVVVGTSLAVYPAAGLLNFAPAHIPKFIIDKKIPQAGKLYGITAIEKNAALGVPDLLEILLRGNYL
jgi:NAD-dependent deacetylase